MHLLKAQEEDDRCVLNVGKFVWNGALCFHDTQDIQIYTFIGSELKSSQTAAFFKRVN